MILYQRLFWSGHKGNLAKQSGCLKNYFMFLKLGRLDWLSS